MSTVDVVILAVILLGVLFAINRAIEHSARQTQVLVSAIAELKAKPADPDKKPPADMPYDLWSYLQDERLERKEEESREERAKGEEQRLRAAIAAANKRSLGRKATVARLTADLGKVLEGEKIRQEERKARNEKLIAGWKAEPYQLWHRDKYGDTWRCQGGWRHLANAVQRVEYFTQPDSYCFFKLYEIRSDGGSVLYRYSSEEEAKKRAAKWLPKA